MAAGPNLMRHRNGMLLLLSLDNNKLNKDSILRHYLNKDSIKL